VGDDGIRILAGAAAAGRVGRLLTRRRFLALGALGTAALAVLGACGGDDGDEAGSARPSASSSGASSASRASIASRASNASRASTASGASGASSPSSAAIGTDPTARSFRLYTWASYDDPDLMKRFGPVTIDVYNSNEEAVGKLEAGGAGYDIVVPTGPYVPELVDHDILLPLDLERIPNFKNIDARYRDQPFDHANRYSVCKDFGSTGWIYDNTVIKTPIRSWSDFIHAAQNEASGRTSLLNAPPDVCGVYFWANGINWNTEDPVQLDACEDMIVNELAPHVKAFTSYPGIQLAQRTYVLSQAFNGDARQGLLSVDDPSRYTWGFGAPTSEIWMDNWCILRGARNVDASYNFINFILDPHNSATDMAFHGYDTGVTGVRELLPSDTKFLDMVFLTPEVLATLVPGMVNSAEARQIEILEKAKARAGT
jgi:spermidine/putrescine transport system substrate-binding protein